MINKNRKSNDQIINIKQIPMTGIINYIVSNDCDLVIVIKNKKL